MGGGVKTGGTGRPNAEWQSVRRNAEKRFSVKPRGYGEKKSTQRRKGAKSQGVGGIPWLALMLAEASHCKLRRRAEFGGESRGDLRSEEWRGQETTPQRVGGQETTPQRVGGQETTPQRVGGQETTPQRSCIRARYRCSNVHSTPSSNGNSGLGLFLYTKASGPACVTPGESTAMISVAMGA